MNSTRLPCLLLAAGLLGLALSPRLLPLLAPAVLHSDFLMGLVQGIFLGIEILGVTLMLRRVRGTSSCCELFRR